jgi:glycosyltransferase involved in cell wall biosynthesis
MPDREPFFSIVVPTHARPRQLAACLQALASLDYPIGRFEVIIVDDGGVIGPDDVVSPFRGRLDITLLRQPHAGPAAARNAGAAQARGQFLAFTDDDCAPARDWLWALAARFASTPDCAIGGLTVNALATNPYAIASQQIIDYLYHYNDAAPDRPRFFTTNNLALTAGLFHDLGGFDTTFPLAAAEDREFCARWRQHGLPLVYAAEVVVYHAHALTLLGFARQHFTYGRGAVFFQQARTRRGEAGIGLHPLSFYWNLVRYPHERRTYRAAPFISTLVVLSQAAYATGYCWERAKSLVPGPAGQRTGTPSPV